MSKMTDATPAITIKPKDLAANCEALDALLALVPPPADVLDVRYGMGGWARAVLGRWPALRLYHGFEADPGTAAAAWKGRGVSLSVAEFVPDAKYADRDLLLADFNRATTLRRRELEQLLPLRPKRLVFTDVACVKLHLNYRSYGLTGPDLAAYWAAFKVPGYVFEAFERRHHAASTALYRRTD